MKGTQASPWSGRLAWSLCAMTVALVLLASVISIVEPTAAGPTEPSPTGPTLDDAVSPAVWAVAVLQAMAFVTLAVAGAIVAVRRPRNPIGWLLCVAGLFLAMTVTGNVLYWWSAFGRPEPHPSVEWLLWIENWSWIPAVAPLTVVPLLFPTGAPPTPRWRLVGWVGAAAGLGMLVSAAFGPGPLENSAWVDNPVGIDHSGLEAINEGAFSVWALASLAAASSLVVRYRRSRGAERQQVKWVAAAGCLLAVCFAAWGFVTAVVSEPAAWTVLLVGLAGFAVAVAVALLRYRLYDVDVVINRTPVYGALTAFLAGMYVVSLVLLQLALNGVTGDSSLAVAASTLAVAALFRPARSRIQETVDRRFFRRKYDVQLTLAAFTGGLRDEVALDALSAELVGVVTRAMEPAHVSLWLREPVR